MIRSFRHKGLERLHVSGDAKRLPPDMVLRIRVLLHAIGVALSVADLDVASYRLHALKGDRKGTWAITVRANWRIVFRFEEGDAYDVDFVDYH